MTEAQVRALLTELYIAGTFRCDDDGPHEGTHWVRLEGFLTPEIFNALTSALRPSPVRV